mgnify:CR=1 FL=1
MIPDAAKAAPFASVKLIPDIDPRTSRSAAGEVLLIIVFSLAPYFIPLPFMFLELFVGLIQAFLFAMLTLVSISLHTAVHEEH